MTATWCPCIVRPEPPDLTDEYTEHGRKIIVIGQFTFVKDIVYNTCFFSETQCILCFDSVMLKCFGRFHSIDLQ